MNRNHRIGIVHAMLALLMLAVLGKAGHVQLAQGRAWAELAHRQHFTARTIPAPRGAIMDAAGRVLATSRDLVKIEIAPREVRSGEARRLRRALVDAGVEPAVAARVLDADRSWLVVPGRFVAEDVAPITAMRGVYTTMVSDRTYAMSSGLRALLGRVDVAGNGSEGLELALDSLLRGVSGATALVRDVRGRTLASPTRRGSRPQRGHSVTLTINQDLQAIAERTLSDAVARMDADGGDIVILDPRSGAVLALAGVRGGAFAPSLTTVTEPFEPGSTLKPLIAAGLLARGKARVTDRVPSLGGVYELHGRRIHDEPHDGAPTPAQLTLAEVIRYSSNVGIAQFAERFAPREQYETLRDFGLGTPTGVPYPSEAAGTLREPERWSRQSSASLAMGYEIAVTPLQLAAAYAAIANGGELLEPALIKEIRSSDGELRYRHQRRVVRRVVPTEVAATLRGLLSGVVARGTAVDADMATYRLAGKTGTPRRTVDGRYAPMQYNPNFVGIFPAEAPQLVVVVKLGSPRSSIYGGRTAAPLTKAILEAALAARDAALNRSALPARGAAAVQAGTARRAVATARRAEATRREILPDTGSRSVVLELTAQPRDQSTGVSRRQLRAVPDVRGMTLRNAVRSLHSAGFRVQIARGASPSTATVPAAGMLASPGSLVRLRHNR
jgi:cell division protein FtsI (penicillin-binding protein 3)